MRSFDRDRNAARRAPLRGALLALIAVVGGVLLGHFAWNAATSSSGPKTASSHFGLRNPEAGAAVPRVGEEGGPQSEEGEGSSGGGEVSSSVASKVDSGLVDINTELGLEGSAAAGTGMVVTSSGEVITNNHVIAGATKITATDVSNGQTYTAHVVGYDYGHDVAVLQLEGASSLQTVSFGNSYSVKIGQSTATIGNAGGAGGTPTATSAQVSAVNQAITANDSSAGTSERLAGLIQIAGDVQPGDSGGPLVNASGEVLGMDTAASTSFQFQSSGNEAFAIPINHVRAIAAKILEGHETETAHVGATGMLGVMVQHHAEEGAVVASVIPGAPAAQSGLGEGDQITSLDGSTVGSPTDLSHLILKHHPGDSVTVSWRTPEGQQQSAMIKLAEGPPQ